MISSNPFNPARPRTLVSWSGLILPLLVLVACSAEPESARLSVGDGEDRMTVSIPQRLQAAALHDSTDGVLSATVSMDGGTPVAMTISGTTASATIPDVPVGQHTFAIVFAFTHDTFGTLLVSQASKSIDVVTGDNAAAFQQADYDFASLDDDADGVSNFDELVAETNPKALPTWGDAIWGSHQWTSSN